MVPSRSMCRTGGAVALLAVVAAACRLPGMPITPAPAPVPFAGAADCPTMPADSYWHADVSGLPVHERSADWIAAIGASSGLKADFGAGEWDGGPIGIPYVVVDGTQPAVAVSFLYADESDPGPYRVPPDAPIEGGPAATGDRHVLVVDRDACTLAELFDAHPQPDGTWAAGSGAVFDLTSNALRPAGWTSADAAGLPVLPGLVRYEEVEAGHVDHAIRVTAPRTQRAYLWPARHFASSSTDPALPPMGAWFRLRADVDLSGLSDQARPIAEAMKVHGLLLADNGSAWYLSGVPDERWDDDALRDLLDLVGSDLEAVDASGLMVDPDSGAVVAG